MANKIWWLWKINSTVCIRFWTQWQVHRIKNLLLVEVIIIRWWPGYIFLLKKTIVSCTFLGVTTDWMRSKQPNGNPSRSWPWSLRVPGWNNPELNSLQPMVIILTNHADFLRKFDSLVAIERKMGSSCHERDCPGHGRCRYFIWVPITSQLHFPAKDGTEGKG